MVTTPQNGDGYKCSCGFITDDKKKFFAHIGPANRKDGKGSHVSLGRVDLTTGEITMPPWPERSKEQKDESVYGKKEKHLSKDGKVTTVRTTDVLAQASEVRFVPRIFTTTYTTIMQQAMDASIRWFGWPSNMPFEDFLDTVLVKYFREHGVTLGQYSVDDSLLQAAAEKAATEEVLEEVE